MKRYWSCEICDKIEQTSPHAFSVTHDHGGTLYQLTPSKKERQKKDPRDLKTMENDVVWPLYSEYIRRRAANGNGLAQCVTCGRWSHWKDLQAGHFISRAKKAVKFHDSNVHCQCVWCNITMKGNMVAYHDYMVKTYGQEEIDKLQYLSRQTYKFTYVRLEALRRDIKTALERMG